MEIKAKEIPEKIRVRIEKLRALADRGVGGEQSNAERLLRELCATYGYRPEELLSEEKKQYEFKIRKSFTQLFLQVFASLFGTKEEWMKIKVYRDGSIFCELTKAQWIEFSELWEWHKANFAAERRRMRKLFEKAYYEGYGLYSIGSCPEWDEQMANRKSRKKGLSFEDAVAVAEMANNVSKKKFHKAIEG